METLTFDLLTLELVRNVSRGMDNLPVNFGVSATFRCRVTDKRASDWRYNFITLTSDLWRHRECRWCRSSYSIPVPSLKFVSLPFGRYGAFSVSTLIGLVTLVFDLSTLNGVTGHQCHGLPSCQFSASYIPTSILDLGLGTGQTDGQTNDHYQCLMSPTV